MRRISWIFALLLGLGRFAEAQQPTPSPTVQVGVTAGLIQNRPNDTRPPYYDDWYAEARYAGSISYYWTRNIKTEYEYAWSNEDPRYIQEYNVIGGVPLPYYFEEFHQLQQHSLRMVYQFGENQWVHPYVSAGAVLEMDRQHRHFPITYQPSGRGGVVLVHPEMTTAKESHTSGGVSIGGGAKFYMSRRAFLNTGATATFSKPARTVSLVAGFGIEF
jgi:Outer membrane protein beta-barrel domain